MKTNKEVAELFAQGFSKYNDKAIESLHMFIDGDTVYSYGYNFPIAKMLKDNFIIINSDSYSVSTSKHQSLVKNALSLENKYVIESPDCDPVKANDYIENKIKEAENKQKRARSESSARAWKDQEIKYKLMMIDFETAIVKKII